MKVYELIAKLEGMPQYNEVGLVYDGAIRLDVECVWLARNGFVALSGEGAVVYEDEDRPADAPTSEQEPYWCSGD